MMRAERGRVGLIRGAVLGVVVACLAAPGAQADVDGASIVSFLNAQRAAHGNFSDIREEPSWSDGCANHDRYGAMNGFLAHHEEPHRPGYTPEGDRAARTSVLYSGGSWTASSNPFEEAPIHLHQLLSPFIARMGAWETQGYGCATTQADLSHPPAAEDTTFTYPSDGTTGWRWSEVASEGPFTPGETVGIAQGTRTGPTLYALFSGPGLDTFADARVVTASVAGPTGPVPIVTFDNTSPQVGVFLPPGAQILPRSPLEPNSAYVATIRASVQPFSDAGAREFSRSWSFTTAAAPAPPPPSAAEDMGSAPAVQSTSGITPSPAGSSGSGSTPPPAGGATDGRGGAAPARRCRSSLSRLRVSARRLRLDLRACGPARVRFVVRRGRRVIWRTTLRVNRTTGGATQPLRGLRRGRYTATVSLGRVSRRITFRLR